MTKITDSFLHRGPSLAVYEIECSVVLLSWTVWVRSGDRMTSSILKDYVWKCFWTKKMMGLSSIPTDGARHQRFVMLHYFQQYHVALLLSSGQARNKIACFQCNYLRDSHRSSSCESNSNETNRRGLNLFPHLKMQSVLYCMLIKTEFNKRQFRIHIQNNLPWHINAELPEAVSNSDSRTWNGQLFSTSRQVSLQTSTFPRFPFWRWRYSGSSVEHAQ